MTPPARGLTTVLVANRGEIAVRVIATLRRMGLRSVAVFTDLDAGAPHVRAADSAVPLGAADGYLQADRVIAAAVTTGAEAVHPGYGFLAENPAFARACADAGLVFVGPPVAAIAAMADKARARELMVAAGVPVVPGSHGHDLDDAALVAAAHDIGMPVMVKPVAGGGGKGMTVVEDAAALPAALQAARRQAAGAFGDDRLLVERFIDRPRHIEVQVLADACGTVLHLGERECSLQRRHQKVVEEAPSPLLDDATRARIGASAVAAARACGYQGAGTVEFIVSDAAPDTFFFLEMNTRLQVEHPVTELVTGVDLVEWQVRIAAGEALPWTQADVTTHGHAIEARVYAEDPARDFLPTGGTVLAFDPPAGTGIRVDAGIATGSRVPPTYDPLLAKVVAHGADRAEALRRLDRALSDLTLLGVGSNTGFLRRLLADDDVRRGALDTGLIGRRLAALAGQPVPDHALVAAALVCAVPALVDPVPPGRVPSVFDLPGGWRVGEHAWVPVRLRAGDRVVELRVQGPPGAARVRIDGAEPRPASATFHPGAAVAVTFGGTRRDHQVVATDTVVWVGHAGDAWALHREQRATTGRATDRRGGPVTAPMPGNVVAVEVAGGEQVVAGQALAIVEAMKMEHQVLAPADGVVARVAVAAGDQVEIDQVLLEIEAS